MENPRSFVVCVVDVLDAVRESCPDARAVVEEREVLTDAVFIDVGLVRLSEPVGTGAMSVWMLDRVVSELDRLDEELLDELVKLEIVDRISVDVGDG
jgi:hypothetical protein